MCLVTWTHDTAVWRLMKIMCFDLLSSGEAMRRRVLINWRTSSSYLELSLKCPYRARCLLWSRPQITQDILHSTFRDIRSVVSQIKYANILRTWGFKTPSRWLPTCGPPTCPRGSGLLQAASRHTLNILTAITFIVSPCIFVHLIFHQLMHLYILLKYYHRQLL